MFKKLKDKLAEEVKSSPQRIQQFAQAAQAAVTSASSSISDITNNDLFSIGDNEGQQSRAEASKGSQQNTFQEVPLLQPALSTSSDPAEYNLPPQDMLDNQRLRRLSNSSFASDVSFRLPSYETPSVYHLQSDMEVSASEAEERGFSSGAVSLDRVTKEQLYAAYRRTQERYKKYRTQYSDLARHYKLLERENAKARSVLVETQDKALRRISELREQCSLEQSAKAHLEKALRVDIEEKNMKIEALNTKVQLLQNDSDVRNSNISQKEDTKAKPSEGDGVQLINLSNDNESANTTGSSVAEITALNNKIEKMEQLINKYKESLKTSKEKNSQINIELQILTNELEKKNKDLEALQGTLSELEEANKKILDLNSLNEDLQNKINVYEFSKTKELSTLEQDYEKAQEEISELRKRIAVYSKKEEEYAISLAENKLSIHKELESKETEIKSLKDKLEESVKEVQSLHIVITDYKNNVTTLEAKNTKLSTQNSELVSYKNKITELESQLEELTKKCHNLEQQRTKADESYKCLQLQLKQETAEKLAMIDRNSYLENRNSQLSEENTKKSSQISNLENELLKKETSLGEQVLDDSEKTELYEELNDWKDKYAKLESEIQEERDELIKLQSEIEKLLANHELLQTQNSEFRKVVADLRADNEILQDKLIKHNKLRSNCLVLAKEIRDAKKLLHLTLNDAKSLQKISNEAFNSLLHEINYSLKHVSFNETQSKVDEYNKLKMEYELLQNEVQTATEKNNILSDKLRILQDENNNLKSAKNVFEVQKTVTAEEVKNVTVQYNSVLNELNSAKESNECLTYRLNEFENNFQNLQIAIEFEKSQSAEATEKTIRLEKEKQSLLDQVKSLESECDSIRNKLDALQIQHKNITAELNVTKNEKSNLMDQVKIVEENKPLIIKLQEDIQRLTVEKEILIKQVKSSENECLSIRKELDDLQIQHKDNTAELNAAKNEKINLIGQIKIMEEDKSLINKLQDDIKSLNVEKELLIEQVKSSENECVSIRKDLDALQIQHEKNTAELNAVKNENINLIDQLKITEDNKSLIIKLQRDIQSLTVENLSIKTQAQILSESYNKLETEINDVRNSHAIMETEKDLLNKTITELENSLRKEVINIKIQTEEPQTTEILCTKEIFEDSEQNPDKSNESGKMKAINLQDIKSQQTLELSSKYQTLKSEYDLLKEENRCFKSDIEGLQTYLTKISKENSELNDKMRELIATSEHSADSKDAFSDASEIGMELQSIKEKCNDLQRENSLLLEENLELKDQLQSQNYITETKYSNGSGATDEKYNNLLQVNSSLEKRIGELELMNKSFNGNIVQVQEKNEKLRLSNEKLERRLDEALVSLRHLHSLQENTELEYLRNILYEYLTGSGTHSITLAKVLAAIVKFDDMQTKQVLQKEKERQGILRQLGLI